MGKNTQSEHVHRGKANMASMLPAPGAINEDSAVWVLELRRRLGLTRVAFAALINASPATVLLWETGESRPDRHGTRMSMVHHGRKVGMPKIPPSHREKAATGPLFDPEIERRFSAVFGTQEV